MAGVLFLALALLSSPDPLSLLAAVAIHEAAHVITAFLFGWGAPTVSTRAAGLRLSYYGDHSRVSTIAVTLSGCFFGAITAFVPAFSQNLRLYSLGFSVVNLLPVTCLDGGEALLCILERIVLPDRAYVILRTASVITVILLWVLSTAIQLKAGQNVTLLAVSVYLAVSVLADGR